MAVRQVQICEAPVEVVDSFCYLGEVIRCEGGAETAVGGGIACAWKSWRELASLLVNQNTVSRLAAEHRYTEMCEIGAPVWGRYLGYNKTA